MKILIIGAGHCGQGLSKVFKERRISHVLMHHDDDWKSVLDKEKPVLVVNAAAIAGHKACDKAGELATFTANVDFAYDVQQASKMYAVDAQCVLISTAAVYAPPGGTPKKETDVRYAPNLYAASKIKMEDTCTESIIFRVSNFIGDGTHPTDYHNRIKKWQWAADTYVSTLELTRFADVLVRVALHCEKITGIFNLADPGFKHLPTYVRHLHEKPLEIKPKDALSHDASVSHILDTSKAVRRKLLYE